MADMNLLTPSASPNQLGKSGVRRVNNLPIVLGASVLGLFLLMMVWVAADRAKPAATKPQETHFKAGDGEYLAETITGNKREGFVAPLEGLPQSETPLLIAMPDEAHDTPPLPPRLNGPHPKIMAPPAATRAEQQKNQLFEAAVKSKTSVPLLDLQRQKAQNTLRAQNQERLGSEGPDNLKDDPTNHFAEQLKRLRQGKENGSPSIKLAKTQKTGDRWSLGQRVEAMPSPYTLRAGFIIPATLMTGMNADLPGQILGQVSQNVYDTATGKFLLIPQGSRLVGSYTSDIAYGQSRVLVAWQRIIFPNGDALDIGAMPGADGIGQAGFHDQVHNHYLRIFGSALLMSGITAGVALSDNQNNSIYSQPSTSAVISESLGQQLGNTTTQLINKNLNISPTLEIRPGFRFNVMCVKDLVFDRPYPFASSERTAP
jgi:type IV secretion system protein VirB10